MDYMTVVNVIADQFGGNRSFYMIGAKHKTGIDEKRGALAFKHMKTRVNNKPANYCKITLNESDLYDLEFGWIRGMNYTVREKIENVFAEDLKRVFEDTTKLYLTL